MSQEDESDSVDSSKKKKRKKRKNKKRKKDGVLPGYKYRKKSFFDDDHDYEWTRGEADWHITKKKRGTPRGEWHWHMTEEE